jgi:hypothetical protein
MEVECISFGVVGLLFADICRRLTERDVLILCHCQLAGGWIVLCRRMCWSVIVVARRLTLKRNDVYDGHRYPHEPSGHVGSSLAVFISSGYNWLSRRSLPNYHRGPRALRLPRSDGEGRHR